ANADHSVIIFEYASAVSLSRANAGGIPEDLNATGDLDLRTDMTILGRAVAHTTVDGNDLDRVFHVLNGAQVLIQDIIATDGTAAVGGGIRVSGNGNLILNDVWIGNSNATDSGGGLAVDTPGTAEVHQSNIFFN